MFINCKKTLEFTNPETGEACRFPRGYLGSVPEWVTKLWYFSAAVNDATITYVGNVPKSAVPQPADSDAPTPRDESPEGGDGKPKSPAKPAK